MFEALAEAIDELVLTGDAAELCAIVGLRDRLDAKLTIAVGECHSAELHRLAGHASVPAMLRSSGMTARDATALSGLAKKLRVAKQTADAWLTGTLNGGQAKTLASIATGRSRERFAANESAIIEAIAPLSVADTLVVVRKWKAIVDAVENSPAPAPERCELHVSTVLDTVVLNGSFDAESGSIIAKAIDQATVERPGQPPALARAEALTEICRFYLDFHGTLSPKVIARKQRPHLNISISLDDLQAKLPAIVHDTGLPLGPEAVEQLLCDAKVHRYLWSAKSATLDYGRAERTAPPDLAAAVIERDGGCRGRNCDRGAEHCQIHHLVYWEDDGPTSIDNLGLFCPFCHRKIHRHRIRVDLSPDGTMTFTTPFGETWQTKPRSQLPRLPFGTLRAAS